MKFWLIIYEQVLVEKIVTETERSSSTWVKQLALLLYVASPQGLIHPRQGDLQNALHLRAMYIQFTFRSLFLESDSQIVP